MSILEEQEAEIHALCRKYRIKELYAFGSATRNDFSDSSDIDLAVVFFRNEIKGSFDQYFNFKFEMESLLGRKVDLVCLGSIRNGVFRKEVENSKSLIYAA